MGFRQRLETKTSTKIVQAMHRLDPDVEAEVHDAPCHIIDESHVGVVFPFEGKYMLAFRCQGKWWGWPVTRDDLDLHKVVAGGLTRFMMPLDGPALLLDSFGGINDSAATFVLSSRQSRRNG